VATGASYSCSTTFRNHLARQTAVASAAIVSAALLPGSQRVGRPTGSSVHPAAFGSIASSSHARRAQPRSTCSFRSQPTPRTQAAGNEQP
jgi:hypothetical protein